jgi:type I restriction enzyme, S subunit
LSRDHLLGFRFVPPTRSEQKAIGMLLGVLDDRIDNLRQTIVTLQDIGQALFKSWFVDFDPVRAKAEGREPEGIDPATAALFPGEFEDSELGPIPKGWGVARFDHEFDFTMGQSPPGSTYNSEKVGVAFFQGCTDFGDVFPRERVYCSQPTRFARAGDLLMSVRAPVGSLNVARSNCSIGRGLCAIRHKSGSTGLTQQFVKACMTRIETAAGEGALFKSLSKQQLAGLPVLVSDAAITQAIVSLLDPLTARMMAAASQAELLSTLRDTLLPRLISGKLRLPEASAAVEEALA